MTADQVIQLFGVFAGVVTTLFGFRSVSKNFDAKLADAIRGKVDVTIYAAKVKELHDLRNSDREELVSLRTEVRMLRESKHA